ncbi:MAG: hypothetical protein ACRDPG_10320 [Nocardioidaceae bacterium]
MKALRPILAGVLTAGLVSLPIAADAGSASGAAGPAAQPTPSMATSSTRYNTWIKFLNFSHVDAWRQRSTIRGQLIGYVNKKSGSLRGRWIRLDRKILGTSIWHRIATTRTSRASYSEFVFHFNAVGNAKYRAVYRGSAQLQPSSRVTEMFVHRRFGASLHNGTSFARFRGRVTPAYGHKVIYLQRRHCAGCSWHTVRRKNTGSRGVWRFRVGAPVTGRWWWKVMTPPSTRYIRSYSGVFTTQHA